MRFTDAYQKHYEGAVVDGHDGRDRYQAVFGYDVDEEGHTHSASFWIFEVEAWDHPSGRCNYLVRDSIGMEWTPYLDETDPIADGFIKWDGCHELVLDQQHFCGIQSSTEFFAMLTRVFEKAVGIVYRSRPSELEDNLDLVFRT